MVTFNINNKNNIPPLINNMLVNIKKYKYHIFIGEIGAGKTTIIKFILNCLKIDMNIVTSPTYNYIKIFNQKQKKFAHVDLYRVNTYEHALEIIRSEEATLYFIEWGAILINNTEFYETINNKLTIWNINMNTNQRLLNTYPILI